MKILLHCCCGPCTIYPLETLRAAGHMVYGFSANHIHPYTEWRRRLETLQTYAAAADLPLIVDDVYRLEEFLHAVVFREANRCSWCYHDRLQRAAAVARRGRFDAFTTTLLYSKFQRHELIRDIGVAVGKERGVPFYYEDFRPGWKAGIEASRRRGMYRQQYCGCIFSEAERYRERRGRDSGKTTGNTDTT